MPFQEGATGPGPGARRSRWTAAPVPSLPGRARPRHALGGLAAGMLLLLAACTTPPAVVPPATGSFPDVGAQIMATALDQFAQAGSFRFQTSTVHDWEEAGVAHSWVFVGSGAYEAPGRFYSFMEGPADVFLRVVVRDGAILAENSRGPVPNPPLDFGGPTPGSSPLTAIAYLRNQQQVSGFALATLENEPVYRISYVPNLARVAALDTGQPDALARVDAVEGQVFVTRDTSTIRQQIVTVRGTDPAGRPTTVEMTMRFSDYGRPVTIPAVP